MPLSVANCSAVTAKNRNTTPAPIIAPSSGRWSSLVTKETFASRSSSGVSGGSDVGWSGGAHRVPASASFSISAALDFSTKPGPVSTNWPPPTVLRFVLLSVRKTTGR